MKDTARWCSREIIRAPFFYALCLREKDFHAELKHIKLPKKVWPEYIKNWHSSATCHWFTNEKKQTVTAIICMQGWEQREDIAVYGLLTHEAVHLWQEAKELYGEKSPSIEFEAYAIQNIAQNLFQQFKDQTK